MDRQSLDAYLAARAAQPDDFQRHSLESAELEAAQAELRLQEALVKSNASEDGLCLRAHLWFRPRSCGMPSGVVSPPPGAMRRLEWAAYECGCASEALHHAVTNSPAVGGAVGRASLKT